MAVSTSATRYNKGLTSGRDVKIILTTATYTTNDLIAIEATRTGQTAVILTAWDTANGNVTTASVSGNHIKIGAAGGEQNQTLTCMYTWRDT